MIRMLANYYNADAAPDKRWKSVPINAVSELLEHKDAMSISCFGSNPESIAAARERAILIAERLHFTCGVEAAEKSYRRDGRLHVDTIGWRAVRQFVGAWTPKQLAASQSKFKKELSALAL